MRVPRTRPVYPRDHPHRLPHTRSVTDSDCRKFDRFPTPRSEIRRHRVAVDLRGPTTYLEHTITDQHGVPFQPLLPAGRPLRLPGPAHSHQRQPGRRAGEVGADEICAGEVEIDGTIPRVVEVEVEVEVKGAGEVVVKVEVVGEVVGEVVCEVAVKVEVEGEVVGEVAVAGEGAVKVEVEAMVVGEGAVAGDGEVVGEVVGEVAVAGEVAGWSVPAFLDAGLSCQVGYLPVA